MVVGVWLRKWVVRWGLDRPGGWWAHGTCWVSGRFMCVCVRMRACACLLYVPAIQTKRTYAQARTEANKHKQPQPH